MDIDAVILDWMHENVNDIAVRFKGDFWWMFNDKTSASWGWTEPEKVNGYRVVWLHRSSEKRYAQTGGGDESSAVYDFITEEKFQKGESEEIKR